MCLVIANTAAALAKTNCIIAERYTPAQKHDLWQSSYFRGHFVYCRFCGLYSNIKTQMLKSEPCYIPDHAANYRRRIIGRFAKREHPVTCTLIGRPSPFRLSEEWETLQSLSRDTAAQEEPFLSAEIFQGRTLNASSNNLSDIASSRDDVPAAAQPTSCKEAEVDNANSFKWCIDDVRRARASGHDLKVSKSECEREVGILNHFYCTQSTRNVLPTTAVELAKVVEQGRFTAPAIAFALFEEEEDPLASEVEFLNFLPRWAV